MLKAKLRAWLIELIREAIQLELKRVPFTAPETAQPIPPVKFETAAVGQIRQRIRAVSTTFEDMQRNNEPEEANVQA